MGQRGHERAVREGRGRVSRSRMATGVRTTEHVQEVKNRSVAADVLTKLKLSSQATTPGPSGEGEHGD